MGLLNTMPANIYISNCSYAELFLFIYMQN